ncbi:hypothetical protein EX30DRAFT_347089 [Ascodesmis nigricans]|uniref:Uncharacterized protein n=1 Tax=Ascodesmis nigricans TaxID=341454 RepID=A0A4S2N132_9PEZI|nr:hypothetical protein EX30DRAFT_347089 [Ascodesmis nigricans]
MSTRPVSLLQNFFGPSHGKCWPGCTLQHTSSLPRVPVPGMPRSKAPRPAGDDVMEMSTMVCNHTYREYLIGKIGAIGSASGPIRRTDSITLQSSLANVETDSLHLSIPNKPFPVPCWASIQTREPFVTTILRPNGFHSLLSGFLP